MKRKSSSASCHPYRRAHHLSVKVADSSCRDLRYLLLVLVIIELLYTVQVSFREHALVPEPFLIVGLIAVTRRILVVNAAFAGMPRRRTRRSAWR